jgi:hypothetical protein
MVRNLNLVAATGREKPENPIVLAYDAGFVCNPTTNLSRAWAPAAHSATWTLHAQTRSQARVEGYPNLKSSRDYEREKLVLNSELRASVVLQCSLMFYIVYNINNLSFSC